MFRTDNVPNPKLLCKYFPECKRPGCAWGHSELMGKYKTIMCRKGYKCTIPNCAFAHKLNEIRRKYDPFENIYWDTHKRKWKKQPSFFVDHPPLPPLPPLPPPSIYSMKSAVKWMIAYIDKNPDSLMSQVGSKIKKKFPEKSARQIIRMGVEEGLLEIVQGPQIGQERVKLKDQEELLVPSRTRPGSSATLQTLSDLESVKNRREELREKLKRRREDAPVSPVAKRRKTKAEKANDPDNYVLNPKTGRYVKKDSERGKELCV